MSLAGTYDCSIKTPMGEQAGTFDVIPDKDGSGFTGSVANDLGSMAVRDGAIDGNTLFWKMDMTTPMAMELTCEATVEGDQLTGTVKAGIFGAMDMTGARRA